LPEGGKRFLGRGTMGEPETILMGHYRLDHAWPDIEQLKKIRNIAQPIKMLSTPPFAL
jgi:predicted component of type VI protein secretion system